MLGWPNGKGAESCRVKSGLVRKFAKPVGSARVGSNPIPSVADGGKMASFEEEAAKFNLKGAIITMIMGAFGFLVALQWRDAIKLTIDTFLPGGEGLGYSYLVAIIVTLIAVVVAFILMKVKDMNLIPDHHEELIKRKAKKKVRRVVRKVRIVKGGSGSTE